jgi:hypothetical protein
MRPGSEAFTSSDRLDEAVELEQHCALIDATILSLGREAAGKEAPAAGEDDGNWKL